MGSIYQALQLVSAIAFGLVGIAAIVDWARRRGLTRASLAIALGGLGAVSVISQITQHYPQLQLPTSFVTIPLFLASGYGLLLLRNQLIPYRRWIFIGATALVVLTGVVTLGAILLAGPNLQQQSSSTTKLDPPVIVALILFLLVWTVCVVQPAISLLIASRGRPAVQRARIRSLSLAYVTIIIVLAVDIVVLSATGFKPTGNLGVQIATELVIIGTAPLMYVSFSPPAPLRQLWRSREEGQFRQSLHDLLLATSDRTELARQALGWVIRLVGADGGLIADGNRLLAVEGLGGVEATELLRAAGDMHGTGSLPVPQPRSAFRFPLSLSDGEGSVILVAGPFTPIFGADELGRVELYTVSLTAAMDRAALVEELRQNQATLERRVRERTAELEATNKELEAFSYTVSHDLRQPLRAIDGFSRALGESVESKNLDLQSRHYLDAISRNAQQMGRLIDALLGLSRIGRQSLNPRPVSPEQIVRQIADGFIEEGNGHAPEFEFGELPPVQGDPLLLEQVFTNLIGNAVKYSAKAERPRIEIGSQRGEDGSVVYYVRDNGAGFDMRYADKLFGVFQRLHSSRDYEGTGAGLAIVQRIVHRHGGRVWADGEVGRGATFYFTLTGGG
ncbi:MAG TPA: ATP-binding protein [Candidatus Dormibacteraeota bacterium]